MNAQTPLNQEKRAVKVIELWAWPSVFEKILGGIRTFDVRKDVGYIAGDVLRYRERDFVGEGEHRTAYYTGRELHAAIRCVMHGTRTDEYESPKGENPIARGYVVVAIKVQKDSVKLTRDASPETTPARNGAERTAA